ncbi:GDSL-like Lipase/Acylhydrolase family protein [bacterium A37T11]|nr:GDSL-like Lipase/Acylhydrolase family protein [bacterium A37T11]
MQWYEDEVKNLENKGLLHGYEAESLFYGSSSIRLWDSLDRDFEGFKPLNLGFGGSTLAACDWFFERIMLGYHPKRLVVYAGDNDLGDGRHPEEVFIFFQQLALRVHERFGDLPCYFISLKPSLSRWHILGQFKYANQLIAGEIEKNLPHWKYVDVFSHMLDASGRPVHAYFIDDGLHLSEEGYKVWTNIIKVEITEEQLII